MDPGDFSVAMAYRKFSDSGIRMRTGSSLLVIGSISEVTRRQVAYLQKKRQMKLCTVKIRELLDDFEREKNRILGEADLLPELFCLITEPVPLKLNCREAEEAARRLAEIGFAVLELRRTEIRCVYQSGGDVAKYFLEILEPEALDLIDEVAPLAVYGKTVGGMWDGAADSDKRRYDRGGGHSGQDAQICGAEEKRRDFQRPGTVTVQLAERLQAVGKDSGEDYVKKNSGDPYRGCCRSRAGNCGESVGPSGSI